MQKLNFKKIYPIIIFLLLPFLYSTVLAPTMSRLRNHNPRQTKFMKYYLDKISRPGHTYYLSYYFVPLREISPSLSKAVVFAEDCDFYTHHGVDWSSIWLSFRGNLRRGKIVHGGSTITMQLCKNLYLYPRKTFSRKFIEILLATNLEKILSKNRILELYLNVIEWGPGIYGAENAAQYYFSKSARELNAEESALLAAIIMSPRSYKPEKYNPFFQRRQRWIAAHLANPNTPNAQYLPDIWPIEGLAAAPAPEINTTVISKNNSVSFTPTVVSENLEFPPSRYGIESRFEKLVSGDISNQRF